MSLIASRQGLPWLLCTLAASAGSSAQQESPAKADLAAWRLRLEAAAERWLESDQTDTRLLAATVAILLEEAAPGLRWLGDLLPQSLAARQEPRHKGIIALATHAVLGFVEQQHGCGYVYTGQYLPLQALQPYAGDLLFEWLLDTPDWYPDTQRVRLVPALRDLQPSAPDPQRVAKVQALFADEASEPLNLRRALACMLWQWGNREPANGLLEELQAKVAEGDDEDRVRTLLDLANLQYELREYKAAAATHRTLQTIAKTAKVALRPVDWYWAACIYALLQQVDRGMEALQRCAEVQLDRSTDSSLHLPRKLFDSDPELAGLRADPRFAALVQRLFPPTDDKERER